MYITEVYDLPATRLYLEDILWNGEKQGKYVCIVDIYLSKVKLKLIIKIHLKLNFGVQSVMYLFVALKQGPTVFKITILEHNKNVFNI